MRFAVERFKFLHEILQPARLTTIMDVGANPANKPAYQHVLREGYCDVWGFEPLETAYNELMAKKGPNEFYEPYAIGDGRSHTFHVCRAGVFSSLLAPNPAVFDYFGKFHSMMKVKKRIPIETRRLDDLPQIPKPDLLKIDVQGAEKMVIENAKVTLSDAVMIITEVSFIPLYQNQPLFHEQAALLDGMGFQMLGFDHLVGRHISNPAMASLRGHEHQAQLLDGDAIFIRSLIEHGTYSDEQLKQLVLLADGVIGCFDLAAKGLWHLIDRGVCGKDRMREYISLTPFHDVA